MAENEKPQRDAKGRLLPGVVLNKGGRQSKTRLELRKALEHLTPRALDVVSERLHDKSEAKRYQAAKLVIEYTIPKPKQSIEITPPENPEDNPPLIDVIRRLNNNPLGKAFLDHAGIILPETVVDAEKREDSANEPDSEPF